MLNLSDKDLDRLSQEAAQQYEPTDVGPKLWEKLEARLDRDLGKVQPNPGSGIHRLPFYYAPAILIILGVGYYFVRLHHRSSSGISSASPPFALVQQVPANQNTASPSSPNPIRADKQTSTSSSNSVTHPDASAGNAPGARGSQAAGATGSPTTGATHSPTTGDGIGSAASAETGRTGDPGIATSGLRTNGHRAARSTITGSGDDYGSSRTSAAPGKKGASPASASAANVPGLPGATGIRKLRELNYSSVGGPVPLTHGAYIDDSALRAFNLASIRTPVSRRGGLHINRSLVFGLHGAPDFASVNSVAGDRAGSTFGLSVDYQFASHAYIGTGLFYSRKVFAAAPQDYHAPMGYYIRNHMATMMSSQVQFIKGRFDMLEVPLNLRYDVSTGDNAIFFLNAGTSSYFFTTEDCGYYYLWYNQPREQSHSYSDNSFSLLSTLNLSAGGEFGISNSLSLMIAPYIKIPTRNLGFGQVQLTSFGIDFALRFAPVISRKR